MQNHISLALERRVNRLHEPLAGRGAIARINVHMLAPEALRAMIRIPVPFHKKSAPLAGEVLLGLLEFLCGGHCEIIITKDPLFQCQNDKGSEGLKIGVKKNQQETRYLS